MKIDSREIKRFIKYSSIGIATFIFDLLILWILVEYLNIHYLFATAIAFLCAVSLNYLIGRATIFRITKRSVFRGYVNFIGIALFGIALTTGGVALLTLFLGLHYILARILVSGAIGMFNYTLNICYNFKIVGIYK